MGFSDGVWKMFIKVCATQCPVVGGTNGCRQRKYFLDPDDWRCSRQSVFRMQTRKQNHEKWKGLSDAELGCKSLQLPGSA